MHHIRIHRRHLRDFLQLKLLWVKQSKSFKRYILVASIVGSKLIWFKESVRLKHFIWWNKRAHPTMVKTIELLYISTSMWCIQKMTKKNKCKIFLVINTYQNHLGQSSSPVLQSSLLAMPVQHIPLNPNWSNQSTILHNDFHIVSHRSVQYPVQNNSVQPKIILQIAIDKSNIKFQHLDHFATETYTYFYT